MKFFYLLSIISLISLYSAETYTTFPFIIEAENCECVDKTWTSVYDTIIKGSYSGEGFAYILDAPFSFKVNVSEEGMYQFSAKLAQVVTPEGRLQTISINNLDFQYFVPYYDTWTDFDFGIHRLYKGENIITIKPIYGYAQYDTITISKAVFPDLSLINSTLSDPLATIETQKLQDIFGSLYGTHIISGQQETYAGGNDYNYELEFEYIKNVTGKYPAIRGFDFINYNSVYGWDDNTTERLIEWAKIKGGIAEVSWHISVPKNMESYTIGDRLEAADYTFGTETTFVPENCIIEGKKEKLYWDNVINSIAIQLKRIQDENIPIIFRPLHEAEGNGGVDGSGAWFWWGKSGAEVYVQIWKYLYEKLTKEYGIHNLIWEQNLYTYSTDSNKWYSGENYVDMIGYDKYNYEFNRHDGKTEGPNLDAETDIFYGLVKHGENKKIVALAENDCIPSLNNLIVEQAGWLYFNPWYGDYIMKEDINSKTDLKEIYTSDYCITLEDLPNLRQKLENTQCTKVKRVYNDETCTNAPTSNSHFKCILKIDGNNKSCEEVKKTCLEIKNDASEEICNDAPVSDLDKKCIVNTEKANECQEIIKEEEQTQSTSQKITPIEKETISKTQPEETSKTTEKITNSENEIVKNSYKLETDKMVENNDKISNEIENLNESNEFISILDSQNINNKTVENGKERNTSDYIKFYIYLLCMIFIS